ncbi:MAG: SBBP repeat-containing protein [Fimbriimonadales bacterium]
MAGADLTPEWLTRIASSYSDSLTSVLVDRAGRVYIVGSTGVPSNRSVRAAALDPDGTIRWSSVLSHGQASGAALGADGALYIAGSVPGQGGVSELLLLQCDASTGDLLQTYRYRRGAGVATSGGAVAVDAQGNLYIMGSTVGDGADVLLLKLDASLQLQWTQVWDGPASAPYSQDSSVQMLLDSAGNPVLLIGAVMADNQPDYMVVKYSPSGALLWQQNWGTRAGDTPMKMVMDASDDLYVTGATTSNGILAYGTIKLRGVDGQLLWEQVDVQALRDIGRSLALDAQGNVYITGSVDPEGNESNFNDNFYTLKREGATGAPRLWSHLYGQNCVNCFDVPVDIAVDSAGHVFVVGRTSSPPLVNDMILFVLSAQTGQEQNRSVVDSGSLIWGVDPSILRLDSRENLYVGAVFRNLNTEARELTVIKYRSLTRPQGDVNGDGCVDDSDVLAVLFAFGQSGGSLAEDVNGDGVVDDSDLLMALFNFGSGC